MKTAGASTPRPALTGHIPRLAPTPGQRGSRRMSTACWELGQGSCWLAHSPVTHPASPASTSGRHRITKKAPRSLTGAQRVRSGFLLDQTGHEFLFPSTHEPLPARPALTQARRLLRPTSLHETSTQKSYRQKKHAGLGGSGSIGSQQ